MTEHNKNPITIDVRDTHPLADGTYTTAYMDSETGQYGVLMVFPRDRGSVADSLVAANERVKELRRKGADDEISVENLSELDRALHNHRADVLQSVDWRSMSPGLVLTVYQLHNVAVEE